jgi:hypothetical protein
LGAVIAQSVQRWAKGWTIGVLGFDSRRDLGIFFYTTSSRTALRPTQPPIQWVPGALSLGVKWLGREADHSPPSVPRSKNEWWYTSTSQYAFMAWCLFKTQGQIYLFTFTLLLLLLLLLLLFSVSLEGRQNLNATVYWCSCAFYAPMKISAEY